MTSKTNSTLALPAAKAGPLKAATVYARDGWRLVPLHDVTSGACSCHKDAACPSASKHPRISDWGNAASADPETIADWAEQWPRANVGVATGTASGFFALDVDPDKGGAETLAALMAKHGPLPQTVEARTGSGGTHYLFTLPDFELGNTAGGLGPGLDTRGNGGLIVVAPSVSAKGPYRWVRPPWSTAIAAPASWLVEMLRPRATTLNAASVERGYFPPASPEVLGQAAAALEAHGPAIENKGGDHHTFVAASMLSHDFALTEAEAWPLLYEWNQGCQPPWSDQALAAKLRGGEKYATGTYGSKRTLDSLTTARHLIRAWQANATEATMFELVERCRTLPFDDPMRRRAMETELMAATGEGARALAIPPAKRRAPELSVTVSSWEGLDVSSTGAPVTNLNNVVSMIERIKLEVHFDTFFQRVVTADGREWGDADDRALTLQLQRQHGLSKMPSQVVSEGVRTYAEREQRNAVREVFEGYVWDGTPRVRDFLTRAMGAPSNEYVMAASTNLLRSIAARVLRPGCKVDTMTVAEGFQGEGKSSAFCELATERLFGEVSEPLTSKDFPQALQGKLIMEFPELDALNRADVAAVKRILSCRVDRYRPSYGRVAQDFPRQGVFVGTTNRDDWNRDDTGARRFLPITCTRIDLPYIRANREQLFAEAIHEVKVGAPWWVMPVEAAQAEQEARRQAHPWEAILATHLSTVSRTTITELFEVPLNKSVSQLTKGDQMQVASILKKLGWVRVDGRVDGRHLKHWVRGGAEGGDDATL